jgi:hypothetical protein
MNITEVMVSSFLLGMIATLSLQISSSTGVAFRKSFDIDKRGTEVNRINELVRYEVSKWRMIGDPFYAIDYDITEADCGSNMAQIMLNEMAIESDGKLEADGRTLLVHNEGWPSAVIYLPQIGWCP